MMSFNHLHQLRLKSVAFLASTGIPRNSLSSCQSPLYMVSLSQSSFSHFVEPCQSTAIILSLLSLPLQFCWTNMCPTRSGRYMSSEYDHLLSVQEKYVTNDVVTVLQQYQHIGVSSMCNQDSRLLVPEGGLNLRLMKPLPDHCL